MRGLGRTVFSGDQAEEFQVEVLDIIRNFYPKKDVILVRLNGERVEATGVASGMSGSPVYIDNKLIGALALRFGIFSKEAIGGVVPIEDMLKIVRQEQYHDQELGPQALSGGSNTYVEAALWREHEFDWQTIVSQFSHRLIQPSLSQWQAIECPLVFSGFNSAVVEKFAPLFATLGFRPVLGSGNASIAGDSRSPNDITPGSAISTVIIHGDMGINATGTVTWMDQNNILAFGHSLFNLGPLNLPLASTRILATPPSMMATEKMPQAMQIIGRMTQDRLTGIYGTLGEFSPTVPVEVKFTSPWLDQQSFHFEYTPDPMLKVITPLYLNIAIINAVVSAQQSGSSNSIELKAQLYLKNQQVIEIEDFYSSSGRLGNMNPFGNITAASNQVALIMGALTVNDFQSAAIEKMTLNFNLIPGRKVLNIKNIWNDKTSVSPGDKINLTIFLQPVGEPEQRIYQTLEIPENVTGNRLSVVVGSGDDINSLDYRSNPQRLIPQSYAHLQQLIKKRRKNNILYIQLRGYDTGVLVDGQELPSLPRSIYSIMDSRNSANRKTRVSDRVLLEHQIPLDYQIEGSKVGFLFIKKDKKKTWQGGS